MAQAKCTLCAKHCEDLVTVEEKVPASQKPVRMVLQHLANCIKTQLLFYGDSFVCATCLRELTEYDDHMLRLLNYQRKLTGMLRASLHNCPEDSGNASAEGKSQSEHDVLSNLDDRSSASRMNIKQEEISDNCSLDELEDTNRAVFENNDDVDVVDDDDVYGPLKVECHVCHKLFENRENLDMHVWQEHEVGNYLTCHICGVQRKDEEYLALHMNVHEGKTENECRYCPKRYARPVNTLRHMRMHWNKKKYQCEKCGERFSQDNLLYNHKLRHETEDNPLICSICNQRFRTRKTYKHHMEIHQTNRKRHYCHICQKSFTERYTLKMHLKTHMETAGNDQEQIVEVIVQPEDEQEDLTDGNVQTNVPEVDRYETVLAVEALMEDHTAFKCVICSSQWENKEALNNHLEVEHDVAFK